MSASPLRGQFVACHAGEPVLIGLTMSPYTYLPCFTNTADLAAVLADRQVVWETAKCIDDPAKLLATVPPEVHVIFNLRRTPEGSYRYFRLAR